MLPCLAYPSCSHQPQFSCDCYPPPLLLPWAPTVSDAWRFLCKVASFSCHLSTKRSAAWRTPRYHLTALSGPFLSSSVFPHNYLFFFSRIEQEKLETFPNWKFNRRQNTWKASGSNIWRNEIGKYVNTKKVRGNNICKF